MSFIIGISIVLFIITVIIGLFIHHAITHEGKLFEFADFQEFTTAIFKSHEAVIIALLLIMFGVMI